MSHGATTLDANVVPMTVGLVVALPQEMNEIQRAFRPEGERTSRLGDKFYHCVHQQHPKIEVWMAQMHDMGLLAAAHSTNQLIRELQPDLLVLCGIAGRLDEDLQLGDVVIPRSVTHYMAKSKVEDTTTNGFTFQFEGDRYQVDAALHAQVLHLVQQMISRNAPELSRQQIGDIFPDLPAGLPAQITVTFDPIVSGDIVCASVHFKRLLRDRAGQRKGAALEMEAAGLAHIAQYNRVPWLVIRGISDGADLDKSRTDANWRKAAAYTSGAILAALLPGLSQVVPRFSDFPTIPQPKEDQSATNPPHPICDTAPSASRERLNWDSSLLPTLQRIIAEGGSGDFVVMTREVPARWNALLVSGDADSVDDTSRLIDQCQQLLSDVDKCLTGLVTLTTTPPVIGVTKGSIVSDDWVLVRGSQILGKRDLMDPNVRMIDVRVTYFQPSGADTPAIMSWFNEVTRSFTWWDAVPDRVKGDTHS